MLTLTLVEPPAPSGRLPAWLKRDLPRGNENFYTHNLIRELDRMVRVGTKPNGRSAGRGTATPVSATSARGRGLAPCCAANRRYKRRAERVAEAATAAGLRHVVITSRRATTARRRRDHFARCVVAVVRTQAGSGADA
jgi:lipoic acid synthetase